MNDPSDETNPEPAPYGKIGWIDLTVDAAEDVRDFYQQVAGWTSQPIPVDDHHDYCMNADSGDTVAGICHAKGPNAGIPPVWMVYINVPDIHDTVSKCKSCGGEVVQPPRPAGGGMCAILRDPAGVVFGVYQPE